MIFAIIPIFLLYLILRPSYSGTTAESNDEFGALTAAVTVWAIVLFAMTETLSLLGLITKPALLACWLAVALVIALGVVLRMKKKNIVPADALMPEKRCIRMIKDSSADEKAMMAVATVCAAAVVILAWKTVPYNWDSMTYHLPRIMTWAQNKSVAHYATSDTRQLSSPVLAEFVNLHLYVLAGNDNAFNLLQAFSYCFNGAAVYAIATQLGLDKKWRFIALAIYLSMPIAFAEALTTQVDNFAAVWMMIFAYFCNRLLAKEQISLKRDARDAFLLGCCMGLGYAAKPSVCIAMAVFALGLLIARIIKKDKIGVLISCVLIAGGCAVILMLPEALRNINTFGSVTESNVSSRQLVGTLKPNYLLANLIRNIVYNFPNVYITTSSAISWKIILLVSRVLGVDMDDTSISEEAFSLTRANNMQHDTAINAIVVLLFVIVMAAAVIRLIVRRKTSLNAFCRCAAAAFLVFMTILRWEPYETRFQIGYLALLCPLIAYALSSMLEKTPGKDSAIRGIILFICACSFISLFDTHYAKYKESAAERPAGYFASNPQAYEGWQAVANIINEKGYDEIGINASIMYYEYPVWAMCPEVERVECITFPDSTADKYADYSFQPDAIIWFNTLNEAAMEWHGAEYSAIYSNGDYNLLERIS